MPAPGPVLVLTDLRLGRPDGPLAAAETLRPLWSDAAGVIIVGEPKAAGAPDRGAAMRFARRVRDLSAADGVALTVLGGETDPLLPDAPCAPLALDGSAVAVTAAAFEADASPWHTHAREMSALCRGVLARLRTGMPRGGGPDRDAQRAGLLAKARATAGAIWHERTLAERVEAWTTVHAPEARLVVTGHPLHPGVRRFGGITLVNLGSCGWPRTPVALRIDPSGAELRAVLPGAGGTLSLGNAAAWQAAA